MRPSDAAEHALERADLALDRMEQWKVHLQNLSSDNISGVDESSFLGVELRAAAIVAVMAELEALLRDMLVGIGEYINEAQIRECDLVPSLRALAAHARFQSIRDSSDPERTWENRLQVTTMDSSHLVAGLPKRAGKSPQPPLDGRTIQPRHFSIIWTVLGIDPYWPDAAIVVSLKRLTSLRNDIAHRNLPLRDVFSAPGLLSKDVSVHVDRLGLLVTYIGTAWSTYLSNESFLAQSTAPQLAQ